MASADYEMWSDKWHEERNEELRIQRNREIFDQQTRNQNLSSAAAGASIGAGVGAIAGVFIVGAVLYFALFLLVWLVYIGLIAFAIFCVSWIFTKLIGFSAYIDFLLLIGICVLGLYSQGVIDISSFHLWYPTHENVLGALKAIFSWIVNLFK